VVTVFIYIIIIIVIVWGIVYRLGIVLFSNTIKTLDLLPSSSARDATHSLGPVNGS
jgi:hypothetical protein